MPNIPRATLILLIALPLAGCGRPYMPPEGEVPSSSTPPIMYALRTDLMVIKLLDGAPKHWPSSGFPPLRSARNPSSTPDADIGDELRKQVGKNILDPERSLSPAQAAQLARMMEEAFGTPAEPRVSVPTWERLVGDALYRPDLEKSLFANVAAFLTERGNWKSEPWRQDWNDATTRTPAVSPTKAMPVSAEK